MANENEKPRQYALVNERGHAVDVITAADVVQANREAQKRGLYAIPLARADKRLRREVEKLTRLPGVAA